MFENYDITRFAVLNLGFFGFVFTGKQLFRNIQFPTLLIALFYLYNLLACCWAMNFFDAIYDTQKMLIPLCITVIFMSAFAEEKFRNDLYKAVAASTFICILYALFQLAQLREYTILNLYQITSFFEHKNVFASYLFLSFPFMILLYLNTDKKWKYFTVFLMAVNLILLLVLQTKSVWFSLFLAFAALFLLSGKAIVAYARKKIVFFSVGFGLLIVLISSLNLWEKFNLFAYSKSESAVERLKIWNKTNQLIAENPFFGVGPGNWKYEYMKFGVGDVENVALNHVTFQKPHNDFLWILAENGIIGFLLVLVILVYVAVLFFKAKNRTISAKICFAFLLGLLADAFFSFPKEKISHLLLASVLFSILLLDLKPKLFPIGELKQKVLKISFFLAIAFSLLIGFFRLKGEYYSMKILEADLANSPDKMIAYGKRSLSVFYQTDLTAIPISSYMGLAYHKKNQYDSVFYYSRESYLISPYNFEVLTNYGYILEKFQQHQEARKILSESYRINPLHEKTLYNLVVLEYNSKNYGEAKKWLLKIPDHELKYGSIRLKIEAKLQGK